MTMPVPRMQPVARGQRKIMLKKRWIVRLSPHRDMTGRWLNENNALAWLSDGGYPDGTILWLPHQKFELLVYKKKAYVLTSGRDLTEVSSDVFLTYPFERSRHER
jgi:hypothetical protein